MQNIDAHELIQWTNDIVLDYVEEQKLELTEVSLTNMKVTVSKLLTLYLSLSFDATVDLDLIKSITLSTKDMYARNIALEILLNVPLVDLFEDPYVRQPVLDQLNTAILAMSS